MNQMVGCSSGDGALWNRVSLQVQGRGAGGDGVLWNWVSLQVQGRGAGGDGGLCNRVSLQVQGRGAGGDGGLWNRVSLQVQGRGAGGNGGLWNRVSLQVEGRGAGRAMGSLPPFRSRAHLAKTGRDSEPASSNLRAHLAKLPTPGRSSSGGGGLCKCNGVSLQGGSEPPSSSPDDPSASSAHDKLDLLHNKLDLLHNKLGLFHRKLEDITSTKTSLKRLMWWILCAVLSVLCVVLVVGMLYSVAGGRCYVEAELNRVVKTAFLAFADDAEISDKLDELIIAKVDTTVAYISSIHTWYRWLFGKSWYRWLFGK